MTFRFLPSQFLPAAATLAVATSVWASPMDIAERLDVAPVIEGHFVQTEKLVSIPQPFQCEGFSFSGKTTFYCGKQNFRSPPLPFITTKRLKRTFT